MNRKTRRGFLIPAAVAFLALPALLWASGDVPHRTLLKDALAILTILSFCLMLGQFYLARGNAAAVRDLGFGRAVRYHKVIGYGFTGVLLAHPFFVVVPRYLESGVDPLDAFVTMVTTFESTGVVLGLVAWGLLVILLVTSLVRGQLPLKYRAWRVLHGVLSVLFVVAAVWHMIDLGRHTEPAMSIYLIAAAAGGVALLVRRYTADVAGNGRPSHD